MNLRTGQAVEVTHWRNAVVAAYAVSGIAFATWVSRLPAIRDGLGRVVSRAAGRTPA